MSAADTFRGVVRGNVIELEQATGLPDGQSVTVTVKLEERPNDPAAVERLKRSFGTWSDDPEGLDEFLRQMRRDRDNDRELHEYTRSRH
jgi:hypothetical protein